tara:strand:+ start:1338 stop:1553 length:216 start_codon:yes stop_codon:yes gene_type:complete
MTLRQYLKIKNLSYGKMAQMLGIRHAKIIHRWTLPFGHKDKSIPRQEYMMKILERTDGAVQPNDFYIEREE